MKNIFKLSGKKTEELIKEVVCERDINYSCSFTEVQPVFSSRQAEKEDVVARAGVWEPGSGREALVLPRRRLDPPSG